MITYSSSREYGYRNRRERSCHEISAFASGSARFVGSWNLSLCSLSGEAFSGIHFICSPCWASVYTRRRNVLTVCSLPSVSRLQKSGKKRCGGTVIHYFSFVGGRDRFYRSLLFAGATILFLPLLTDVFCFDELSCCLFNRTLFKKDGSQVDWDIRLCQPFFFYCTVKGVEEKGEGRSEKG